MCSPCPLPAWNRSRTAAPGLPPPPPVKVTQARVIRSETPGHEAFGTNSGNADRTVAVQVKIYDGLISRQEITQ